jgi:PAS domain S-box-containing protein
MSKKEKTKQELIKELNELCQRIAELEKSEIERKKAEENLRLFSQAIDNSVDGVATGNLKGRITYVNQAFVRMFGYSKEELIGKGIPFIYPKDQLPKLEKAFKATMQGGWIGELVGKRKNGELFPIALSSSLIKDNRGTAIAQMAIHRDITERKKAEEALHESEQKYRTLIESATDFIYMIDKDNKILSVNKAAARLLGKEPEEITEKSIFYLFPGEIAKDFSKNLKKVFKTGTPRHSETKMVARGRESWISVSLSPVKDQKGNVVAVMGVTRDITKRKKVEDELRISEARYRTLVENIPQKIFMKDRDSRYLSVNNNFAGKTDNDFFPKDLADKYRTDDQRIIESGKSEELEEKYLLEGKETWVRTVKTPVKDKKGEIVAVLGIFWDITERKQAEEELKKKNEDLERFNRMAVGRELKMVELKKEINTLLKELGKEPQYKIPAEKTK